MFSVTFRDQIYTAPHDRVFVWSLVFVFGQCWLITVSSLSCRIPGVSNSFDTFLSEAIKLEFSTYTPRTLSVTHIHSEGSPSGRELNDAERAKLNELIVANKAMLAPLEEV